MSDNWLFGYERIGPSSWAYLSSLLTLALYFKFGRFWSVRNLDLIGLILLAPGLILIKYGIDHAGTDSQTSFIEQFGYIWLFSVNGLFLLRLLVDTSMVRRPLLEPNLTAGGLTFLTVALLFFLMTNVIAGTPSKHDLAGSIRAARLGSREASRGEVNTLKTHGPGFPLLYLLPHISTQRLLAEVAEASDSGDADRADNRAEASPTVHAITARFVAIISQVMIALGMVLIGWRHFDNIKTGIAATTLYLLLPYTAIWTGSVTHALPAALMVWAVVFYRRPLLSGCMIGLAFGTVYYPLFLLPLWISFYWPRGLIRFLIGVILTVALLVLTLVFTSADTAMLWSGLKQMFGVHFPISGELGAWQYWHQVYRIPILAAFIFLSLSFVIWPVQKNLGTLMSCSAAIMLGTQFWHAHSGGLACAWYLPLLLLTIFRPNLEDRVALAVLGHGWPWWRRKNGQATVRAA